MPKNKKQIMKITKTQLEQIIREEAASILDEGEGDIKYSDLAGMYGAGSMKPTQPRAARSVTEPEAEEPTLDMPAVVEYLRGIVEGEHADEFQPAQIKVLLEAAEILHGKSGRLALEEGSAPEEKCKDLQKTYKSAHEQYRKEQEPAHPNNKGSKDRWNNTLKNLKKQKDRLLEPGGVGGCALDKLVVDEMETS